MLRGLLRNPPNNAIININIRLSKAKYRCREGYMLEGNKYALVFEGNGWKRRNQNVQVTVFAKFIILSFTPPRNSMSIHVRPPLLRNQLRHKRPSIQTPEFFSGNSSVA